MDWKKSSSLSTPMLSNVCPVTRQLSIAIDLDGIEYTCRLFR
jgi:hypothetical protein